MVTFVDDRNLGYALGASDYLTKPIDRDAARGDPEEVPPRPARRDRPWSSTTTESARGMIRQMLERRAGPCVEAEDGRVGLDRVVDGAAPT